MKHWIIASVTLAWAYANVAKVTESEAQNKTKRGLSEQIQLYGDPSGNKPPITYQDQQAVPTSPSLVAYYANHQKPFIFSNPPSQTKQVFPEPDPPKQVTAQAVVYEYQQTPHNAVSNVHVNQQFQTVSQQETYKAPPPVAEDRPTAPETAHTQVVYTQYPVQHVYHHQPNIPLPPAPYPLVPVRAESVAIPVHHRTIVHHGFQPIQTTHNQPQPNSNLGKYLYVNGKIIYHPAVPSNNQQASSHQGNSGNAHIPNAYPGNTYQGNSHSSNTHPTNTHPGNIHAGNTHPSNTYPANVYPASTYPISNHPYQPVKHHQQTHGNPRYNPQRLNGKLPAATPLSYHYQNHHPPSNVKVKPIPEKPVKKEEDEEEEERENVQNEDDDHEGYEREEEEEDDFRPYVPEQYRSEDDDDEDDHSSYRVEEDEEEDNERGSSKYVKSKPKKYKGESNPFDRYATSDNYKYKEGYKSNTRYGKPFFNSKDSKAKSSKPKTHYKAYKYTRKGNGKPKIEMIEGKHSQNVPIVHNQKFFRENKWFVSNSHEE